jgi:predicted XRE-type DNA-binding protein
MQEEEVMTIGSDNVFEDIGLPRPKEALAKAKLRLRITTIIEDRELSEEEVAKRLRISPPKKVSSILGDLLDGYLDEFTVGQLMNYLSALNEDTEMIVCEAQRSVRFSVMTAIS